MRLAQKPANTPRTMEEVVKDIFDGLAGLQNVLYRKSASQRELQAVWDDVLRLTRAWHEGQQMLSASISMSVETTKQRDEAIKALDSKRREWIDFAERQGRRVLATGVTLDKEEIDVEAVTAALDFLAGELRGDASESAQWDVARALEKLGKELKQKGV